MKRDMIKFDYENTKKVRRKVDRKDMMEEKRRKIERTREEMGGDKKRRLNWEVETKKGQERLT